MIPDIKLNDINIRRLEVPNVNVNVQTPQVFSGTPVPVTVDLGTPIVDIPGCVEARNTEDLRQNDARGNMIVCDGNVPSFNPIIYEPNQLLPTWKPGIDTRFGEEKKKEDVDVNDALGAIPKINLPTNTDASTDSINGVECPTPAQNAKEPVGTYLDSFRKKIVEYRILNGECVPITERPAIPEQIIAGIPTSGAIVMTSSIAVVATTAAIFAKPLADNLLKIIKPIIKKVIDKLKNKGKKISVLSVRERRQKQRKLKVSELGDSVGQADRKV